MLTRAAPLTRKTPIRRGGRLRPANSERRRRTFLRNFGERADLVRKMPCLLADRGPSLCEGRVVAAHVKSRGAGGDRRHLVPLCEGHHDQQHRWGIATFQQRHGLDLPAEAARIAAELDARRIP